MDYVKGTDLICLDIDMPQMSGIETARDIRRMDEDVIIVFITNLAQYALNAYEVNAIDYILKPLRYGDFKIKISKVSKYLRQRESEVIEFEAEGKTYMAEISSIYYIEVLTHNTTLHMRGGDLTVRTSLSSIESRLPKGFARSANAYLVNLKYVEKVTFDTVTVKGTELPLTRTRKPAFMDALAEFISGEK